MAKAVSQRVTLCFTALAALGAVAQVSAAIPAPAWERQLRAEGGSAFPPRPLAIRVLADGSSMVVIRVWPGLTAIRYDEAGEVVSSATIHSSFAATEVAIDPFGSLFAIAEPASRGPDYDFWTMKYDGLTGRPMWPAPARFNALAYDRPTALAVDRSGDVFVTGYSGDGSNGRWATLRYDGRTGTPRWGPVFFDTAGYGVPVELSIDPSGDVLITGMMMEGNKPVWGTVKYRGSSGDQIWGPAPLGVITIPMVCPGSCQTPIVAESAFDRAGNVFLTVSSFQSYVDGSDQQWLTVKYEGSTGRTLWGPVRQNGSAFGFEAPHTLTADVDGNLIVAGFTATSRGHEGAIVKYDGSTGALIWGPVLVGPYAFSTQGSLLVEGAGDVIIASTVRSTPSQSDWATAKYDGRTGTLRWGPVYFDGGPYDTVHALALTRQGDAVVTGISQNEIQTLTYAGSSGRIVWGPRSFRGTASFSAPVSLLTDSLGNAIVIGASGERSGTLVKYGTDGTLRWGPVANPPSLNTRGSPRAAALDSNGDLLLTGWTIDGQTRYWETLKYSGDTGALLWGPVRFDGRFGSPVSLAVDRFGDLFVIGQSSASWAIMKYSGATGAALWGPVTYEPFLQGYAQPVGLAVDGRGDVFVIGSARRGLEDYVWGTLKYDGRNGTPLWGPILFDGNFYGNDFPSKLAVDARGDLLVTGTTTQLGTKWATIKYSGSTGRSQWGPIIFESGYGSPTALVLDDAGDVFISGLGNALTAATWSTIKYGGVTGSVIWGPQSFPASRGSQAAASLAIDAGGNAIVTGPSSTGADDNWTTVKYSGASGDALWGPDIYDGGDFERPYAVKTTGTDFLVTGTVSGFIRTVRHTERLAIATLQKDLDPGYCGAPYRGTLSAANGGAPHTWSLAAGELPAGLTLDPLSGQLSGTPLRQGGFIFTARVRDASGNAAEREFTLDVYDGSSHLRITTVANAACLTGGFTLSVAGNYSSYRWFPNGEITPTIIACPSNPTVYALVVTDEMGCELRGAVQLSPARGLPTVERMPPILPHPRPPPPRLGRTE